MTYGSGSWQKSFQKLNIITAGAMMVFAVLGLIMTGLAGDVITFLENHQYLPLAASFGSLMVIFMSSGTRDFRYYHPVEGAIVTFTIVLMVAYTFLTEVQDLIAQYQPWGAIFILIWMVVTSAILGR